MARGFRSLEPERYNVTRPGSWRSKDFEFDRIMACSLPDLLRSGELKSDPSLQLSMQP